MVIDTADIGVIVGRSRYIVFDALMLRKSEKVIMKGKWNRREK